MVAKSTADRCQGGNAVNSEAMARDAVAAAGSTGSADRRVGLRAWIALGALCLVYVLNFLDRSLLSILAKPIQDSLHITDGQLGRIGGLYFAFFYCFIEPADAAELPVGDVEAVLDRLGSISHSSIASSPFRSAGWPIEATG